jgi:carboxyl-terminal processing protease
MRETIQAKLIPGIIVVLITATAFVVGFQAHGIWSQDFTEFELVSEAQRLIDENFIGNIPEDLIIQRGMIRGMVAELGDPYTTYVEPVMHELQTDNLSGEYGGIGAFIRQDEDGYYHIIPFEDGPAARAGIVEGDQLLAVNADRIEPFFNQDELLALIRGPVGTTLSLTIRKADSGEEITLKDIEREAFPIPSVTEYTLPSHPNIGVIAISIFSDKTGNEVESAYQNLVAEGVAAIILDLRGNTGGLLDAGIEVARFFLKDGVVLIEKRKGGGERTYRAESEGVASEVPLAVLVDGGTASASEVVAAALQGNNRAKLFGSHTFGKGSVQLVLELSDGSSLYVTNSQWTTPDGSVLDSEGLQPDALIDPDPSGQDPVMEAAAASLQ